MISRIREHTLCRLGYHCHPRDTIMKYDGGKLPHLCKHCRLILFWGNVTWEPRREWRW